MKPIVYVETNWIIACLFPHDQHFEKAINLLTLATNGTCELRIPEIAFIEAETTMNDRSASFSQELTELENKLRIARAAGFDAGSFNWPEGKKYSTRKLETLLNCLRSNPVIHRFLNPADEVTEIGRAKPELKLSTKDMKDLYILCAILVDRDKHDVNRPAVFMNENHKDFSDAKKKVPPDFYDKHRLLYWRGFDNLTTAVGKWRSKHPSA
jgi:hypothetical protein